MNAEKPVALTGIKPTGTPHIGNYLGAIRPALGLTRRYRGVYFIADYHALTSCHDGATLRSNTLEVAATWLAFGLDTAENLFFKQSDIPEVCELAWVLSCFTGMGVLERAHAYKDATEKKKDVNHGLFAYPLLMAADILLYDTQVVPVGKDQKQHVEMCRDIAIKINQNYGPGTLTIPEPVIADDVATIPGLDGRKMSKSYDNTIAIFASAKEAEKRFKKIVTGSEALDEPKDPETCNVFALYKLFAPPEKTAELAARYRAGGYGYGQAKQALAALYDEWVTPHRRRFEELMANQDQIVAEPRAGALRARAVATVVLDRVRKRCGLSHP